MKNRESKEHIVIDGTGLLLEIDVKNLIGRISRIRVVFFQYMLIVQFFKKCESNKDIFIF